VLASTVKISLRRRDVLRAGLVHALGPIPLAQLKWRIEEKQVLSRIDDETPMASRNRLLTSSGGNEAVAVSTLWDTCLDVLGIDHAFAHPEELLEVSARENEGYATTSDAHRIFAERAAALWTELEAKVGAGGTAGALLKSLTDEDMLDAVRPLLIRHLASHLDQGLSPWHNPARPLGFYAAWRQSVAHDIGWAMDSLPGARLEVSQLPNDAIDTVLVELTWLGLPEDRWPAYLERLALELPGWSGMFLWRHNHPGYANTKDVPVAMMDYLAVRLVLERLVAADCVRRHWNIDFSLAAISEYFHCHPAELWVRHAFHGGDLPEYLLDLIEPHLPATGDAALPQAPGLWEWLAGHIEAWRETPPLPRADFRWPRCQPRPLERSRRRPDFSVGVLHGRPRGGNAPSP